MTPLTDKQLEAAAREYCRLVGVDPDGTAYKTVLENGRSFRNVTNAESIARELRDRDLETIALSVGREADP